MAKSKKGTEESSRSKKPTALTKTISMMADVKKAKLDEHWVPLTRSNTDFVWPYIPAGNIQFEYILGGEFDAKGTNSCPGYPRGAITNIFGAEHSGKTSAALHAAAACCEAGGTVVYIDYENILDVRYAKKLGVPVEDSSRFGLYQPQTLEQGVAALTVAAHNGVDLVVFDSVGAAVPKKLFGMSIEELTDGDTQAIGILARTWGQMLPMVTHHLKQGNCALLAISQTRSAINQQAAAVQGGKAWKFFSAVRLELRYIGTLKAKRYDALQHKNIEAKVGSNIRLKMLKSKIAPTTHWEVDVECVPNRGFDPVRSIANVGVNHKVIKKAGSWYDWERKDGTVIHVQGWEGFLKALRQDSKAVRELDAAIRPLLVSQDSDIDGEIEYAEEYFEEDLVDEDGVPAVTPDYIADIADGKI